MIEMTAHTTCWCPSCAHCYSTLGITTPSLSHPLPVGQHHDDCVHCAAFRRAALAALDAVKVDPAIWEQSFVPRPPTTH